jgi:ubiquitin-like protein ATG12
MDLPPAPIEREPSPELPLTMTASAMLSGLPHGASAALAAAGSFPKEKVVVLFKPVGSAPALKRSQYQIGSAQKFDSVVGSLRRLLKVKETDSLFLYVNNSFAPSLDEIVGNLHRVRFSSLLAS